VASGTTGATTAGLVRFAFHETIFQHEAGDSLGVECAGDLRALVFESEHEKRAAGANDDGRAVGCGRVGRKDGERRIDDVERQFADARRVVFLFGVGPGFGARRFASIEPHDGVLGLQACDAERHGQQAHGGCISHEGAFRSADGSVEVGMMPESTGRQPRNQAVGGIVRSKYESA